jgi:hypothetical protein
VFPLGSWVANVLPSVAVAPAGFVRRRCGVFTLRCREIQLGTPALGAATLFIRALSGGWLMPLTWPTDVFDDC